MTLPSLVIFDCDGVLVDSEMIASEVLAEYLTNHGVPFSAADCRERFTGMSLTSVKGMIEREFGTSLSENFPEEIRALDIEAFENGLAAIDGIEAVLQKMDVPFCIASSGSQEKIANSLRLTGLTRYFGEHIFSATQVANGKPAPDLFQFAAGKMKTLPEKALVIEDSPNGVIGASLAGMRVLGFCGASHAKDDPDYADKLLKAGVDLVFDDMSNLPGLLQN